VPRRIRRCSSTNLQFGRDGDLTPHALRHIAGTNLVRDGEDIVTVAEILGHSIETARRYSLPTEDDKQRAIERLPVDEELARPCPSYRMSVRPSSAAVGRNSAGIPFDLVLGDGDQAGRGAEFRWALLVRGGEVSPVTVLPSSRLAVALVIAVWAVRAQPPTVGPARRGRALVDAVWSVARGTGRSGRGVR
jgi:Phage integrase family